jgi:Ca2+-binding RTX toxin-like protein
MADHNIPAGTTRNSTLAVVGGQSVLIDGRIEVVFDPFGGDIDGIVSAGDGNTIDINGYVGTSSDNTGGVGIRVRSGNTINIASGATVYGPSSGIWAGSAAMVANTIANEGTISSDIGAAIYAVGITHLTNGGMIDGGAFGIAHGTGDDEHLSVLNGGTIKGETAGIKGSNGADTIINLGSIEGQNSILLEGGDDTYDGRNGGAVVGSIDLGQGADTAWGGAGDEVIQGGSGDDSLEGGAGNDVLSGGEDDDVLVGGADNDTYYVDQAGDQVIEGAGEGNDIVYVVTSNYALGEAAEVEMLAAWSQITGSVDITGNSLNNKIVGHNGVNSLKGGGGNDTLEGGKNDDVLDGGSGINTAVFSGRESDYQIIRNANGSITVMDTRTDQDGEDTLTNIRFAKFMGDDKTVTLINSAPTAVGLSNAVVAENAPAFTQVGRLSAVDADGDAISYSLASDPDGAFAIADGYLVLTRPLDFEAKAQHAVSVKATDIYGAEATQSFTISVTDVADTGGGGGGTPVNLVLRGSSRADRLVGQGGHDTLYGGAGKDVLTGGAGQDVFVFDTRLNARTNLDTVTDFSVVDDSVYVDNKYLKKLGSGSASSPKKLKAAFFKVGEKAGDANDYLVYSRKKGVLYYDEDGSGAKAAIAIAKFSNKASLAKNDFFVI